MVNQPDHCEAWKRELTLALTVINITEWANTSHDLIYSLN